MNRDIGEPQGLPENTIWFQDSPEGIGDHAFVVIAVKVCRVEDKYTVEVLSGNLWVFLPDRENPFLVGTPAKPHHFDALEELVEAETINELKPGINIEDYRPVYNPNNERSPNPDPFVQIPIQLTPPQRNED